MYSKADTHIHTTYSDGLMSPEQIIEFIAAHTNLRVVAITDHDTAEGAFVAQAYAQRHSLPVEVIIGQEISTAEGDVVGLFLTATLPVFETAAEAIEAIHAAGGLAVAVHPFSRWATGNKMRGVGSKIFSLPFDAIEARNGFPLNIGSNLLTTLLNRTAGQSLPELGGSDSHVPFTVGHARIRFPGQTAADLRQAIENGTVRPEGMLWSFKSLAQLVPQLLSHGLPKYQPGAGQLEGSPFSELS